MLNSKVFNEMGYGLIQLSSNGDILDANITACDFFELDPKDINNQNILNLSKKDSLRKKFESKCASPEVFHIQTSFTLPNGRKKSCRISAKPEYKDGNLNYILASVHEIKPKQSPIKSFISLNISLILSILIFIHSHPATLNEYYC